MKQIVSLLFFGIALAVVPRVFAHTLKIDRAIGVNLHVDPDDAPVAGVESKFLLDIQDKSGRFNPNNPTNCDCVLTISQNGTPLATLPVIAGGTYAQLRFTFPHGGVYTVVVEGKPKGEGVPFQSFHTQFEYFVRANVSETQTVSTSENALAAFLPYVVLGVGFVVIVLFVL